MILLTNLQSNLNCNVRMHNYNKPIRNKKHNNFGISFNKLNNHLVFIGIFNFLGGKFESKQTLFHSCLHFLGF